MTSGSLQDLYREREKADFVGRQEQLTFFRENLSYALHDRRRRFVINVFGQGGIGKTQLMHRFEEIVAEPARGKAGAQAVTAYVDREVNDIPQVMEEIAAQFAAQRHPLESFAKRHEAYLQRKHEIESDPAAPQGFPRLLGRTVARSGLSLARQIPVGGVVANLVDEDEVADLAGEFTAYLARKLRNRDDVNLVLDPVGTLTPLFLDDLTGIARDRLVALFFDTYENSSDVLDPWLRRVLAGDYGYAPRNILIVIAGRDELDRNHWAPFEALVARRPLDPLDKAAAREYLASKDIHDERTIDVILHLSGRLPLLIAMLASQSPDDPNKVGDPSGEAMKRFLEWIDAPRREVALTAALPRYLNRDVLTVIVAEGAEVFDWLKERPFVTQGEEGWVYHEVVRQQLLRYKQQDAPQSWARLHGHLAQYYAGIAARPDATWEDIRAVEAGGPPESYTILPGAVRSNQVWQKQMLEVLYHRLCQAPDLYLPAALDGFLIALKAHHAFAGRWAETVGGAERDAGVAQAQRWGRRLVEGLEAYEDGRYEDAGTLFTALLEQSSVDKALALGHRGVTHLLRGNRPLALHDFSQAIEQAPENTWVIAHHGETCRQMGRHRTALEDFNRAIELDPDYTWARVLRGELYRERDRFEEAVEDFSKALGAEPQNAWILVLRGETYRQMKRYGEAKADFDRAIALEPNNAWAIAQRGEASRQINELEDALEDFNRAIDVDETYVQSIALRGETLRQMGRQEEALADFERALALEPQNTWLLVLHGQVHLQMEHYEEARKSFEEAIALEPDKAWAIAHRGEAYRLSGDDEKAREDFDRAIEVDPDYAWALALRGELSRQAERYEEALADFDRALAQEPENVWILVLRGEAHRQHGDPEEARADFDRAVELDPDDEWAQDRRKEFLEAQEGSSGNEHG